MRKPDYLPQPHPHRPSKRWLVRLTDSVTGKIKDVPLGRFVEVPDRKPGERETVPPEIQAEWLKVIAAWQAKGKMLVAEQSGLTLDQLFAKWQQFGHTYSAADGKMSRAADTTEDAWRPVSKLFGSMPAAEFTYEHLKQVQMEMIDLDWQRSTCNSQLNRILNVFQYADTVKNIPEGRYMALCGLPKLHRGSLGVREGEPRQSVPRAVVEATLPFLSSVVRDMVRFQLLCACRPCEVCRLQARHVHTRGDQWTYKVPEHKNAHRDMLLHIPLGPQARELLRPYVLKAGGGHLFSPEAALEERRALRRKNRRTPMNAWQAKQKRMKDPKWKPGEFYTTNTYARAITYGVRQANAAARAADPSLPADAVVVPVWSPQQLRRLRATEVYNERGLKAAQKILRHKRQSTTELYLDIDSTLEDAAAIAEEIG